MKKVPYTNTTESIQHKGPYMIMPGATREIESVYLDAKQEDEPVKVAANPVALLLAGNVAAVLAGLAALSVDELDGLELAEQAGANRKGVLTGVAQERLRRADFSSRRDALMAVIESADVEVLQQQRELVAEHPELVDLVEAKLAELAQVAEQTGAISDDQSQD